MYDDLAAYDRAFEHYKQANLAQQAQFDRAVHARFVGNLLDIFDANTLAKRFGQGCPSEQPVFVVGMPRFSSSGITYSIESHGYRLISRHQRALASYGAPLVSVDFELLLICCRTYGWDEYFHPTAFGLNVPGERTVHVRVNDDKNESRVKEVVHAIIVTHSTAGRRSVTDFDFFCDGSALPSR